MHASVVRGLHSVILTVLAGSLMMTAVVMTSQFPTRSEVQRQAQIDAHRHTSSNTTTAINVPLRDTFCISSGSGYKERGLIRRSATVVWCPGGTVRIAARSFDCASGARVPVGARRLARRRRERRAAERFHRADIASCDGTARGSAASPAAAAHTCTYPIATGERGHDSERGVGRCKLHAPTDDFQRQ